MKHLPQIIIATAVVLASLILSRGWVVTHQRHTNIQVTGLASHDFVSDLIVWEATFNRKAPTIQEAFAALKADQATIEKYLHSKGIKANEIVFSSVSINKDIEYVTDKNDVQHPVFKGYVLSQKVQIESNDVDKTETVSREVSELIDKGIELYSDSPNYYYTKLSALKIEMIAKATTDAKTRAQKIAENAGAGLGKLKNADMGIFQITAQNSNEDYSWGGAFNTSSKKKTASITIKLEFEVN